MSSRALRKLQKLREQELQQASLQAEENDESSEDEPVSQPSKPKLNAFDLLNAADDEEEEQESENDAHEPVMQPPEDIPVPAKSAESKKKKKKKNKKKKASPKATDEVTANTKADDEELDEIDRALRELAVDNNRSAQRDATTAATGNNRDASFPKTPAELLAIDPKSLNATNEMRKLFGNVVLENFDQEDAGAGRRRDRNRETIDLGRALTGRYSPASRGQSLAGVTLRRNVLMQGKDEWPRTPSGGLGMELVERSTNGPTVYRIIHNSSYKDVQMQFDMCQARLDFAHMANRELWLVGWRYIANLGMKGTWRTAYEWAKLLLSLNDGDPYCIRLMIDHLALRGREYSHFIELCTQTRLREEWASLPNIQCSLALAYLRLNKPKECREQLRLAMSRYPWVFCKLAQELDIQPMPKQIWGKMPPTDAHELLTELYIVRAKDLWNTPEAVSLIVEVADTLAEEEELVEPPEITLDIARHVVLSDIPKVTTHLPSRFVSGRISASDPLPPYDSEAFRQQSDPTPSYLSRVPEAGRPQWLRDLLGQMNNGAIRFPGFHGGEELHDDDGSTGEGEGEANTTRPHPSADQQPQLEQWLLADGLHSLEAFLRQYGVDRGNWGEVVDYSPLTEYVDALNALQPDTRQRLLHGPIRDSIGEIAIDLLEDELQLLEYDEDEDV
ncbi:Transcriptional repressor TCF25 [Aspergillus parasiticus SU-1]|uniref:Transcriptional repressor TCF25 n=1 Tax=Aspergillus parasiticus (strain ATCC 56775 / NRRL 5862 / SRRC 143 / SU-1) TaxID=1403190 RepID=A0A0F0I7C7_ASPPU|nr:Transcriptional repressor TCF25 [Aspergillus parasiticus SU-1]